jgi:broad specificity phosphatase PhoE
MTERVVTIHLIRHAESLWNVEGRYQGQGDSGLTELGHAQARELAESLARLVPKVDLVFASDLPRVLDTAAPALSALGLDATPDSRLRELDMGSWSGRLFAELAETEPELVAAAAAGSDVRRGGGETFAELRIRVAEALDDIAARCLEAPADPVALVFTHGGPIRVGVAETLGLPSPGNLRLGGLLNCSITTLQQVGSRRRLLRYNVPTITIGAAEGREHPHTGSEGS